MHTLFDVLAWLSAIASGLLVYRWRLRGVTERIAARLGPGYFVALTAGAVAGGIAAGTFNLAWSGDDGFGRSILRALLGGSLAVEAWKGRHGVRGSTGVIFALPIAVAIVVGRLGCFAAGLDELTYGVPTAVPWGVDFGDGVRRRPVQIYESVAMALWAGVLVEGLARRRAFVIAHGFRATMAWYGVQRFAWEFLKPYATVAGPFNLFHLLSLILVAYALRMMHRHVSDPARS